MKNSDQAIQKIGGTLPFNCPKCNMADIFDLYQKRSMIAKLFIFKKENVINHLQCRHCSYKTELKKHDLDNALQLTKLHKMFIDKDIQKDEYLHQTQNFPLESIQNMLSVPKESACPNCSEMVPSSFHDCWNCGEHLPENVHNQSETTGESAIEQMQEQPSATGLDF